MMMTRFLAGRRFQAALSISMILMILGAASAAFPQGTAASQWEPYLIGLGDILEVSVWKNAELAVRVPVRPDGRISLPLVGEVEVAGLTPSAVRDLLAERYQDFITGPGVSVVVAEINSRKIFIMGEVTSSGVYDIVQPTRLMQALAMAGGLTNFAKKDQVVLLRDVDGEQQRTVLSIKEIESGKNLDGNIRLWPGDTIIVP
jgi:polysaccharide export outer membrane protein